MFSFLFALLTLNGAHIPADPDQSKYILDIVSAKGFNSQTHHTTTPDGYILELHRIVRRHRLNVTTSDEPVILMPGMGSTSAAFIVGSPHVPSLDIETGQVGNNLALVLSQAGYDVWLPNVRGNKYSINHVNKSAKDDNFWDYGIDEIVQYDLPTIINYVRNCTKAETVAYIGHSQGTTLMFALLASQPDIYTPIIKPFIAMAPAVMMSTDTLGVLDNFFHITSISMPKKGPLWSEYSQLFQPVKPEVCNNYPGFCQNFIDLVFGPSSKQLNTTRLGVYLAHITSSFSLKTMLQYFQMYNANKFQHFDYDLETNLKVYGQEDPPEYRLKNIKSPHIALIYSQNDLLISLEDIEQIKSQLTVPLLDDYLVPDRYWNHIDFIVGLQTGKYINRRILQILDRALQHQADLDNSV